VSKNERVGILWKFMLVLLISKRSGSTHYGVVTYNLAGWLVEKKVPLKKENGTIYYQITRYTYDKTGKLLTEKPHKNISHLPVSRQYGIPYPILMIKTATPKP
jgi:hypothetical protein